MSARGLGGPGPGRLGLTVAAAAATVAATAPFAVVFEKLTWVLSVVQMVAIIAAFGYLGRRLLLPAPLVGLLNLVGLAVTTFTMFVPSQDRLFGVLPGTATLQHLPTLAQAAVDDIRDLAVPVPVTAGLEFLFVVSVGVVAVMVDFLAVTMRAPAVAGLPLLLLFASAATISPTSVGWLAFVIAAVGWTALLLADSADRSRRWGRTVQLATQAPSREWGSQALGEEFPLASTGRRIAVAAIGLGLVVPLALPSLSPTRWTSGGAGGGAGDTQGTITYSPTVALRGDLTSHTAVPLLSVRSATDAYLRTTALDQFNGRTWTASRVSAARAKATSHIDDPPGVSSHTPKFTTQVTVTKQLRLNWLPAPYPATSLDARGDWRYDTRTQTIYSRRSSTNGLSYTVTSAAIEPSVADLRTVPDPPSAMKAYTRLPPMPSEVLATERTVVRGATTDYDRAIAIQGWLRTNFRYSLDVPSGNSTSDLVNFLVGRQGFCEQFAATMAIFARLAGIPARVAIGFTGGAPDETGRRIVTTHDAHAWPELYFQGYGWLAFEPTPFGDGRGAPPAYAAAGDAAGGTTTNPDDPGTTANGSDPLAHRRDENRPGADVASGAPTPLETSSGPGFPLLPVALVVLVVALIPAAARSLRRRRRLAAARRAEPREAAHLAWTEVRDQARDLGLKWSPATSPRTAQDQLAAEAALGPAAAAALGRLARAEERAAYAPTEPDPAGLVDDVRTVERALARSAPWSRRARAALLPGSVLAVARRAGRRVTDALDSLDRAVGAVGRRLRRSPG